MTNKKTLLLVIGILATVMISLIAFFIWQYIDSQQYLQFSSDKVAVTFSYPKSLTIKSEFSENRTFASDKITLSDANIDIYITFIKRPVVNPENCSPQSPCGNYEGRYPISYNKAGFVVFSKVSGRPVYVSSQGGVSSNIDTGEVRLISSIPEINNDYFLYQEFKGGLTESILLQGYEGEGDKVILQYSFKTEEGILTWESKYKKFLQNILYSLQGG